MRERHETNRLYRIASLSLRNVYAVHGAPAVYRAHEFSGVILCCPVESTRFLRSSGIKNAETRGFPRAENRRRGLLLHDVHALLRTTRDKGNTESAPVIPNDAAPFFHSVSSDDEVSDFKINS